MSSFLPSKSKLLELTKLQCKIFNQNFNPTLQRTGSKILTKKLKGDTIKSYYGPTDFPKFKDLKSMFPALRFTDPDQKYRLRINAAYVYFVFFNFLVICFSLKY